MSDDLMTQAEVEALAECEKRIGDGLRTFMDVGKALMRIRDERLYRLRFPTFEEYCQSAWGMDRRNANRTIEAASIAAELGSMDPTMAPTSVRQARELTGLPADTAAEVMRKAHDDNAGKVTASAIRQAREVVAPKADPWAARIASELAASDEDYREQAATPEPQPVEPSPAVTDWLESSQTVKDSGYVREFTRTLARADDFLLFDAERLAHLLDDTEAAAVARFSESAHRFAETVRRNRSGLRVINGGN